MLVPYFETEHNLSMMVHVCNTRTQEGEAGRFLRVQKQAGLHSEFRASQDYIVSTYLK